MFPLGQQKCSVGAGRSLLGAVWWPLSAVLLAKLCSVVAAQPAYCVELCVQSQSTDFGPAFFGYSSILSVRRPRPCTLCLQQISVQKLQRRGARHSLSVLLMCARHLLGRGWASARTRPTNSSSVWRGYLLGSYAVFACVTQMHSPYPLQMVHP
jgi:hypothetical protein